MKKRHEEQAGYHKGYSTIDQIFNLQSIVQKYLCKKKGRCYVIFVDFSKAFETIPHCKIGVRQGCMLSISFYTVPERIN